LLVGVGLGSALSLLILLYNWKHHT
jgi:hypothetical protein